MLNWSGYNTNQDVFVEQPIQFSHAHHVGGEGIDCRYCHTSVEESAFANIPPTKTCMNCHSQIWTNAPILEPVRASFRDNKPLHWTRVHDLPDFVYFNHSIHVTQGRRLRDLPRPRRPDAADVPEGDAADGVVPRLPPQPGEVSSGREDQVFNMAWERPADDPGLGERLVKEYKIASVEQLTSCSTCHR